MSFTYAHTCKRQPEYKKKKSETILKINRKPEILPNDNKLLLEIYAGRCQFAGYLL